MAIQIYTYPTTFSDELVTLSPEILDDAGRSALGDLAIAGYGVEFGLRRSDMPAITEIARQAPVREYCPKDIASRFGDESMAEAWLAKGRGMVLLPHLETGELAAFGWTGPESCDELPDSQNTFAIRVNERFAGRGLGRPFTAAIVSGSVALFGARNIGLETWQSNQGAVKSYQRAGAELVTTKAGTRPSLQEPGGEVSDTRLFMQFSHTFS